MSPRYRFLTVIAIILCSIENTAQFSAPELDYTQNSDARIVLCQYSKIAESSDENLGICGYYGETCSFTVYRNQIETKKTVSCQCFQEVAPQVTKIFNYIPEAEYTLSAGTGNTVVGKNIDATLHGAWVTVDSVRRAIQLDGIDDYVDFGLISDNCLGNIELCPSGLTLSMWLYPTQLTNGRQWYFGTAPSSKVGLMIRHENHHLWVAVRERTQKWVATSYELSVKWTMITISFVTNGPLSVYIDGCLYEVGLRIEESASQNPTNTVMGKSTLVSNFFGFFKFDEFAYWEKQFRAEDVLSLYLTSE